MAVLKRTVILLTISLLWLMAGDGAAAPSTSTAILSGPLAKIDIKTAEVDAVRRTPQGKLIIAQHYALDPGWLDPLEHQAAATQLVYDYLVHDAMIKPMPQGLHTYSLAEQAELTADFTKAAFRLRPGLTFHDGHPLTAKDVKWTYENYKGVNFKIFQDKLERIGSSTTARSFFISRNRLWSSSTSTTAAVRVLFGSCRSTTTSRWEGRGSSPAPWVLGHSSSSARKPGVEMLFEAWEDYWRRAPAAKTIVVKGIRDPASRLAGLQTGELDLAFGMTGKLLPRLLADRKLRWDPNLTAPWWLAFPGYAEPDSPFH